MPLWYVVKATGATPARVRSKEDLHTACGQTRFGARHPARIMDPDSAPIDVATSGETAHQGVTNPVDVDAVARLDRLAAIGASLGVTELAEEIDALRVRAHEARFYVACVGAFKRGKSTVLNALMGVEVLPTGVLPVTSVPTLLRYGATLGAQIRLQNGGWVEIEIADLAEYVAEARNPGNVKRVVAAEVRVPSDLLAGGMVLVDTPGIGSIIAANTAATEAFVPQIDAALAVIGVDPPLTGDELTLLARVMHDAPHVIVALNKADRFSAEEQQAARSFAERALAASLPQRARGTPAPVLLVSARDTLTGTGSPYEWPALVAALRALDATSGAALARSGMRRGLDRLATRLLRDVDERLAALTRPLADSEGRVRALRVLCDDANTRSRELGALLAVEESTLAATFATMRATFRREVGHAAFATLQEYIAQHVADGARGPSLRRLALQAASDIAESSLRPWFVEQSHQADLLYREVAERFVMLASGYVERLLRTQGEATPGARDAAATLRVETGLRARSQFFFAHMMTMGAPVAPGAWILDRVLPTARRRAAVERAATRYLERLLDTNVARVEGDVRERILESRRALEADVQQALRHVHASASRALANARAMLAHGATATEAERARLLAAQRDVRALFVASPSAKT